MLKTVLKKSENIKKSGNKEKGHSFSTLVKFSEKLTFLTPWSAHVRERIRG